MLRVLIRNNILSSSFRSASTSEPSLKSKINLELFNRLKERNYGHGQAIDKIVVTAIQPCGKKKDILMNRNVSTPIDCSKHISHSLERTTALAQVTYLSGTTEFESPVNRFTQPCQVEFIDFYPTDTEKAKHVNQAFWRSSSILTAAVLQEYFPALEVLPNFNKVTSMFFSATVNDLKAELSGEYLKEVNRRIINLIKTDLQFDVIPVSNAAAAEFGLSPGIQLVRLNEYVCEVDGPVIQAPAQIEKFKLLGTKLNKKSVTVGGVALPYGGNISDFNWDLICKTSQKKFTL